MIPIPILIAILGAILTIFAGTASMFYLEYSNFSTITIAIIQLSIVGLGVFLTALGIIASM